MTQITSSSLQKLKKRFNISAGVNAPSDSISNLDCEAQHEYCPGGYCPVHPQKQYGHRDRYRIISKLGWGCFSTVWLAFDYDTGRFVAVKFQKSKMASREAALDEIRIGENLRNSSGVTRLFDHFETQSENGKHICMVFELVGENLLMLIRARRYKGLPVEVVKRMARDILEGLAQMHAVNVIHTDLKPENILLTELPRRVSQLIEGYEPIPKGGVPLVMRAGDLSGLTKAQKKRLRKKMEKMQQQQSDDGTTTTTSAPSPNFSAPPEKDYPDPIRHTTNDGYVVKIADLGNGCWVHEQFSDDIQTRQYRSPEVTLRATYSTPVDVWSAACVIFELVTGDFLFQPRASKTGAYTREEDHLALMIELLGEFSQRQLRQGRSTSKYFTSKGTLKHISPRATGRTIASILENKYKLSLKDAKEIEEFLKPMLALDPAKRATAEQCLKHEWLANVDINSPIDKDIVHQLNDWLEDPNRESDSEGESDDEEKDAQSADQEQDTESATAQDAVHQRRECEPETHEGKSSGKLAHVHERSM
mmetsp:Transcript_9890/g.36869  ORF Transcript_9890/g.36869 Transcript_9890/m.36869 type:complete len:534 (-) Transcript_9890:25-1626(-)|eukprot:CAMPEP_0117443224 /NCGR_PEP_ID=MMETSP0759-20121206/4581_1 /TAXON_ID=63605 /ORGANISM="Percolomonas cosmopolitus, Strain WS" /LENGTH=533 /DNA_ID=CAMNT_0005235185 /DNA_START=104 /DNA_END=1705 /DNA_ORIENTATION=+